MTRRLALLLAALMALALAAPAAAAPTRAQAKRALAKVLQLQQGKGVRSGFELTPALQTLYAALPSLSGSDRMQAEAILARPDDSQADPSGTHKWNGPEAGGSPVCGVHFCVHWTNAAPDASSKPYAQQLLGILENEVYPCENGTAPTACAGSPGLGWRDPAPDAGIDGGDQVDVYIEDLFSTEQVFGYTALDPGQPQSPSVPHYAYMVLDKDYSRYSQTARAIDEERVTAAHEYNHVLQNAYDYLEDSWMFEATAVYMEDKVYPDINEYLDYVNSWTANTQQPLTAFPSSNLKAYGSAVWNHWLDHRFGPAVVRGAWEQSVAAADFAPGAYGLAIAGAGGGGFSDEFDRFSAAVAEWNAPGSGFPDHYPDVPRNGVLPTGSQTAPFSLAHTTFAFFDVPVPATAPPTIRLVGSLPSGTAGAIALVGRTGADPNAGAVTGNLTPMPTGGTAAVYLDNPAQFGRITAVVVDSDPSKSGFDQVAGDYIFTKDATGVTAAMEEPGVPIATTGPATLTTDHATSVNAGVDPHMNDTAWSIEYGRTTGYGARTAPQSLPAATVGAAAVAVQIAGLKADTLYHYRVVASNAAGIARGQDMTFKTARDVTPPVLRVKVKSQRLRTARARGAAYLLRCSERCTGAAEVVLSRSLARRLRLPTVLGKSRVRLDALAASKQLRVRLSPRAKRLLASERRRLRVTLELSVSDDSRNRARASRSFSLSPR